MKKICVINVWMGKLSDTYPLWLESVKRNPSIDFFVVTDQIENLPEADNVKYIYQNLKSAKKIFENEIGIRIKLGKPYKLCDYKPFWWLFLKERIEEYDFWGYCDVDLIFGDIRSFLSDEFLDKYDKIFDAGNFTLYKNTQEIRNLYKRSQDKDLTVYPYKRMCRTDYSCYFDEFMGMSILSWKYLNEYYDQTKEDYIQDFSWKRLDFNSYITHKSFIFHINNGKVYEINVDENGIITDDLSSGYKGKEFLLVHIQKRKMTINLDLNKEDELSDYWIYPNAYSKDMPTEPLYTKEQCDEYAEMIRVSDNKKRWKNLRQNGILQYIPHYLISRKIRKFIITEKGYF